MQVAQDLEAASAAESGRPESDDSLQRARQKHRSFLNRYYAVTRHVYDVTRRYYLFGRDTLLSRLLEERWDTLLEVGVGTGRNLRELHARRASALYGGVDASDEMVRHVRKRYPWVRLRRGFAESYDLTEPLGARPERILFSYSLSMIPQAGAALENAKRSLAPDGKIVIVDFADMQAMPLPVRLAFQRGWLERFHVHPVDPHLLERAGARLEYGPGRYFLIAEISAD